ncbi:MAG: hypothetical protein LBW85_01185 [Deltaproteobacteria bacterium]|jgi:hypothetical protein|nr:hypothetical protein [Deltaproteobacteria bacterium]
MSILTSGILAGGGSGSGGGAGVPEAPSDGRLYGRRNAAWSPAEAAGYRHVQAAASDAWNVQHNLGSSPVAVWVFDAAGAQVFGDPDHVSATLNQITIRFSVPMSGTAYVRTLP